MIFIALLSQMMLSIDTLPIGTFRKVKEKGYILVDGSSNNLHIDVSKNVPLEGIKIGTCGFKYEVDEETARIPKTLNVAVLRDSAHARDCKKLTYDFTVLEKCVDCDEKDTHGIIYKISKQTKVVGFVKK